VYCASPLGPTLKAPGIVPLLTPAAPMAGTETATAQGVKANAWERRRRCPIVIIVIPTI
jgi:hypothetical protein